MAKNIDFMGATFPDVPRILLPQHEGGLVGFDDTSDGTAIADDIAEGKIAYVNGQKIVGTNQGGVIPTGSQTFTENGTYDVTALAEAVVNVAGGGEFEYEYGEFKPTTDKNTNNTTFTFSKSHATRPFYIMLVYAEATILSANSCAYWVVSSPYDLTGLPVPNTSSTSIYGLLTYGAYTTSGITVGNVLINSLTGSSNTAMDYNMTEEGFHPRFGSSVRYYRANRTYKWIAVWAPTT